MVGSAGGETWNVPNIPWVMYVVGGVAIHGTYWHNQFGKRRMSHGCINMRTNEANWIFRWAKPEPIVGNVATRGLGTPVEIHY